MRGKRPPDPVLLSPDQVWQVIDAQRTSLADLLEDLTDDQWSRPSLCAGWTVRDVAAHLTLQQLGLTDMIGMMRAWRGNLDRTIQHAARRRAAALSTDQIIARIRGTVGSRRHNLGVTPLETLTDILVHGQDIAVPLGRHHEIPPAAAAVSADRVLSMRWPPPLPAARRVRGFRLTATDIHWSTGDGPRVQGPMSAILLVCTGRAAGLRQLSGEGVADLAARLSVPGATGRPS
ncbi:maleylpyruvate isomerase family mycothiol-dependent enzyme [Actinomadura kijaniata]|uniref:maleylpyruvate isomerase family mycothiol-dependent enzyme n=1 Tax=Actinomadura kijaniata TaxID=46161 RepID=UPI00082FE393|nr:maleylpyruvate isomerase family mycothiol-dependent enzyme [Actinomadura kijaniata]